MIPGRTFDPADARPVRDVAFRKAWAEAHPYCFVCGTSADAAPWPGVSVHHLVRPGRSDEACNLMMLCHQCHTLCHGARIRHSDGGYWPILTVGMQLEAKRRRDPDDWDPTRLEQLWARHLPELAGLPGCYEMPSVGVYA